MNDASYSKLLGTADPHPVRWVNPRSNSAIALICEHAGNSVPASLNNLGLTHEQLHEHSAVDIGAQATARRLATMLDAPLLTQQYSRLVIDCNRPTEAPDSIPEISHGTYVPANSAITEYQRNVRIDEIFTPYDAALRRFLEIPERVFAFSIHSFTPCLNDIQRPWDIGLLFRHDSRTSRVLGRYINDNFPELTVGFNQPYQIDDESDWFVPQHAERLELNHSLIEIRNDHVRSDEGQERIATILCAAIRHASDIR